MAGAITAAMRAARAGVGPRVLRVARVERGRIVEERVLHSTTDIEGARLARAGDRWEIKLAKGATARVADGEVACLFQLVVAAPQVTPLIRAALSLAFPDTVPSYCA